MDDKEIVGFALRLLRENAGLNQEQLGRKVRRTVQAVYRHETGKKAPSLDEITAYLRITGCPFSEFEILVSALGRFRQRLASGGGTWRARPRAQSMRPNSASTSGWQRSSATPRAVWPGKYSKRSTAPAGCSGAA